MWCWRLRLPDDGVRCYQTPFEPGWVATKMGGTGAPDDLSLAPRTQAWLAVSDDHEALVTGSYFYHQRPQQTHPAVRDPAVQEQLLERCASLCGTLLP